MKSSAIAGVCAFAVFAAIWPVAAIAAPATCHVHEYATAGLWQDRAHGVQGPGIVLNGGGSFGRSSLAWMGRTIKDDGGQPGDVVFLTAVRYSDNKLPIAVMRRFGGFGAVRAFYVPMCAPRTEYVDVSSSIDQAEGVYIDGGYQSDYVPWRGSAIAHAVDRLYQRGGVVGGVSAGLAILGNFVYDDVAAKARNAVTGTPDAVENPYEPRISLSGPIFHLWPLHGAVTDTHLVARDRLGRLTVFMARLIGDGAITGDPPRVLGIGVDEGSAIVIDRRGQGRLMSDHGDGRAYVVVGGRPKVIRRGRPLEYDNLKLTVLSDRYPMFDFRTWMSPNHSIVLHIDGRQSLYSPFNPYR